MPVNITKQKDKYYKCSGCKKVFNLGPEGKIKGIRTYCSEVDNYVTMRKVKSHDK